MNADMVAASQAENAQKITDIAKAISLAQTTIDAAFEKLEDQSNQLQKLKEEWE